QDAPDNDFKSSITCINTVYNRRCFNDGYHIIHHLKSAMHYTEMMLEFDKNREHYGEQDAIVFDGLDFFSVWLLLMLRQHAMLARRIVPLPGAPERTQEERVAFLKARLKPFPAPA
ncbi:MAG: fatty acid desaturase, partial [Deltaproteobacteria bacterium]|nr:fatty acid desaturase [Deltaproteobacteria bacterium]